MAAGVVNRTLVAIGVTAVVLCGVNVPTGAWSQQGQQQQANQKEKEQAEGEEDTGPGQATGAEEEGAGAAEADWPAGAAPGAVPRPSGTAAACGTEHSAHLQQQNRRAQYGYQQQYVEGLRQQQWRIQIHGSYDYGRDPYFYTARVIGTSAEAVTTRRINTASTCSGRA